jgi:type III pantothenate kinase
LQPKAESMILTIDAGNTRIKGAVFEKDTLVDYFVFAGKEITSEVENSLNKFPLVTNLVVASVRDLDKNALLAFSNRVRIHFITHQDVFPFRNLYQTPLTLGMDRMVLAAGAVMAFPGQNRLVIDAGTCITYDFVDQDNNYLGGAIAPGLRLRYESLHRYTAKLPLLSAEGPEHFIGKSTNQAIHSGIVNGFVYEIDGFIDEYKKDFSKFIIILTGGDTDFLAKRLKNTIFANSNFLLQSLNHIYQYKIKND